MIIVTGGTGFIGSNLVAGLEAIGAERIVVCDVLGCDDKWRNIAKRGLYNMIPPSRLMEYLDEHQDEIEIIFHMGAISSTTETDADLIVETNFVLTRTLWNWCARSGVRFIYASSGSTYGDGTLGFKDLDEPNFLAKLRPLNPYGWSKNLMDRYASSMVYKEDDRLLPTQWAGLKFFNVYGPNEFHKGDQMSVVCKLYPQVAAGAAARLFRSYNSKFEDGGQLRDFVYVGDCVAVMLWLYQNQDVSGLYNVGSGKARSFKDLAIATFEAVGAAPRISFTDMPEGLKNKYQYFTEADISKLRAAGYSRPMTEIEDGVRSLVQKFLTQDDPYR